MYVCTYVYMGECIWMCMHVLKYVRTYIICVYVV